MITQEYIDAHIQELREEWKQANDDRRETILMQVRCLRIAEEMMHKRLQKQAKQHPIPFI